MTPLTLKANVVYYLKGSCDKIQSCIGKTKRHLAMRVEEHLSVKSAIHEYFCSCRDCHSCSIRNFYTLAQANTDFEVKMKEALYMKSIHQN